LAERPARWTDLRRFTDARVGLGRSGNGLPTQAALDFAAAHALARDAVHGALDLDALRAAIPDLIAVRSAAPDRATYLRRPDLGRALHPDDRASLPRTAPEFAFLIADGLCAAGVQAQAAALIAEAGRHGLAGPVVAAAQARVALGDAVGDALGAKAIAVIIGERPGLSAPDSVGIYLTWQPRPGRTDAERNCISNIRPGGLSCADAAAKLAWLVREMRRIRSTGIMLKDEQPARPRIAG